MWCHTKLLSIQLKQEMMSCGMIVSQRRVLGFCRIGHARLLGSFWDVSCSTVVHSNYDRGDWKVGSYHWREDCDKNNLFEKASRKVGWLKVDNLQNFLIALMDKAWKLPCFLWRYSFVALKKELQTASCTGSPKYVLRLLHISGLIWQNVYKLTEFK